MACRNRLDRTFSGVIGNILTIVIVDRSHYFEVYVPNFEILVVLVHGYTKAPFFLLTIQNSLNPLGVKDKYRKRFPVNFKNGFAMARATMGV